MTGRNELCHCGSGKKFKKCCLGKESYLSVIPGGKLNSVSPMWSDELMEASEKLSLAQDDFYSMDLAQFYIDKTKGKGKGTIQKYTSSVKLLGRALSGYFEAFEWEELDPDFWDELLTFDFLEVSEEPSYNSAENFMSVLFQFSKWKDEKDGTENAEFVKFIMDKSKLAIMDCIYILSSIRFQLPPQNIGRIPAMELKNKKAISGLFTVEDMTPSSIVTRNLSDKKAYKISVPKKILQDESVHYGMIFHGIIMKPAGKQTWEFYDVETIYPPKARTFVEKNFF